MYKGLFKVFIITIVSLGFTYCSSNNTNNKITYKATSTDAKQLSAKIAINGMTCQYSCVSTVNKTLKNIEGVENVIIDFDEDNTTDYATVTFNTKNTSAEALMTSIENIGDNLYRVQEIEISDVQKNTSEDNMNNSEEDNTKMVIPQLNILLSLINLFGSLQA